MKQILLVLCVLPQEISSFDNGVTIKARASLGWDLKNVRIAHIIEFSKRTTLYCVNQC